MTRFAFAGSPNRYWGDLTPPKDKGAFFNVLTVPAPTGDSTVATIRLYGPIDSWGGWWGISAEDVSSVLDALPASVEQIILRINSPGGEVFEATTILNLLRAHKASVLAVVDGQAASAASYLAMGCDETVMSPGATLFLHKPSVFAWGNADDLRAAATELDVLQQAITDIYTAKAGDLDWETIMTASTRYTGQQAVDAGLADRVADIPDAGETITAGIPEPIEVVIIDPTADPDDPDDRADAGRPSRMARFRAMFKPPTAAALGSTTTGEETGVAFTDDHLTTMRSTLGLPEDADEAAIVAAIANRTPTLPEGATIVDSAALAQLQSAAAAGAQARTEQLAERRTRAVDEAIRTGRIAAFQRQAYLDRYEVDPEGTQQVIDLFPANTIPVQELGYDAGADTIQGAVADDVLAKIADQYGVSKEALRG